MATEKWCHTEYLIVHRNHSMGSDPPPYFQASGLNNLTSFQICCSVILMVCPLDSKTVWTFVQNYHWLPKIANQKWLKKFNLDFFIPKFWKIEQYYVVVYCLKAIGKNLAKFKSHPQELAEGQQSGPYFLVYVKPIKGCSNCGEAKNGNNM